MWNAIHDRLTDYWPAWAVRRWGEFVALRTFHRAATGVPAYADVLADFGIDRRRITTPAALARTVPVLDATSYDALFPPETRRRSNLRRKTAADAERSFHRPLGRTLRRIFAVHRRPTLVLSMADAPAPVAFFLRAMQSLCWARRWPVSFVVGLDSPDRAVSTAGAARPAEAQVLLFGTATGVDALADRLAQSSAIPRDVSLQRWCLVHDGALSPGAIAHSAHEPRACTAITLADRNRPIFFANDSAATVALRRLCGASESLRRDLFGDDSPRIPLAVNPHRAWVESIDGRLCVTADGAVPMIRYDTGVAGDVLRSEHVVRVLADHGVRPSRMPGHRRQDAPIGFNTPIVALAVNDAAATHRPAQAAVARSEGLPSIQP